MNQNHHVNQINHCSDSIGVAPQIGINGLNQAFNVFIPTFEKYKSIRDFLNAHYVANYGWIFTSDNRQGKVIKRNP